MSRLFVRPWDRFLFRWSRASKKKKVFMYIGVYTLVFGAAFLLACSPLLLAHKSFVIKTDGRNLHLPYLVYVGRYLRQTAASLLKGDLSIPLFDICIGEGSDVIGSLLPWGALEPLYILQAFVPTRYAEYTYTFLAIFHVYLSGLAFSYLCVYFHKRTLHALIGSLIYVFSGYVLFMFMQPWLMTSTFILPLMIVGVDKTLCKKKPYLLIFSTMYGALCGYYTMYMMVVMIALYALVRFFDIYHEKRWREFLSAVGRSAGAFLLGVGLSAAVFLPAVLVFLSAGRSGFSHYQGQYPVADIVAAVMRSIAPTYKMSNGELPNMAFAAIALPALVLLLCSKKRRSLKILAVVAVFSLFSSVAALVMNGFQYPNNRFVFGAALAVAYTVVEMLPELVDMSKRQKWICLLVLGVYTVAVLLPTATRGINYLPVGAIFLALTVVVLTLFSEEKGRRDTNGRALACLLLVAVNVGVNGIYEYAADKGNYTKNLEAFGSEIVRLESGAEREMEPYLLGDSEGRVDGTAFSLGGAFPWHIPSPLFYHSVTNGYVTGFWGEIEAAGNDMSYRVWRTDQRTTVNTLLSTKYQVEAENKTAYVPFGYEAIETTENGNVIFENQYALPWGYTYDTVISYDDLDGMNGLEKQEAMLQAVALEDGTGPARADAADLTFDEERLPYEAKYKNCAWEDGELVVSKANATVTLQFDMEPGTEGYVRLKGIVPHGKGVYDSDLAKIWVKNEFGDISKMSRLAPDTYFAYDGRENYLLNFGYSDEERHELTLTFQEKGTFKLDDIELYALPMDNYPEQVEALRAESMENIRWGTNSLTGTVDLSKDKVLCTSVPYSKGWTATVDGEKTEILRGNYMFMCLPLTAGHHDIEFHYCSPGLKLGVCITALSLCAVGAMLAVDRKKRVRKGA